MRTFSENSVARTTDDERQRPVTPDEIIQEEFYVRADADLNRLCDTHIRVLYIDESRIYS